MNDESFVLYKFRAINKHLIESLVSQSLYFARPDALNDPFDCQIDLKAALKRAESSAAGGRKSLLSSFLRNQKFFDNWKSVVDNFGVCSFSRENRDTLLWSRYADEHRGVCLKYQFRESYFLTDEFQFAAAGDVEYLDEPLTEWLKSAPADMDEFVKGLIHKYLKTKSLAWKYEKESRIIRRKHGAFKFSEPVLNQVCFGLQTPDDDIKLITDLARTYAGCTMFSKMFRDETEFGFTEKAL
jgi:hypothetical protein